MIESHANVIQSHLHVISSHGSVFVCVILSHLILTPEPEPGSQGVVLSSKRNEKILFVCSKMIRKWQRSGYCEVVAIA